MALRLHTELQEEILMKLPVRDLCKYRAVCKLWSHILSSESFLKRYGTESSEFWLILKWADKFISVAEPKDGGVYLIDKVDRWWLPEGGCSFRLASSGGLLLHQNVDMKRMIVSNPLTKLGRTLPYLRLAADETSVYEAIYHSGSFYYVVVVSVRPTKKLFMRMYSTETNAWTSVDSFLPEVEFSRYALEGVICKNILYMFAYPEQDRIARFDLASMSAMPPLVSPKSGINKLHSFIQVNGEINLLVQQKSDFVLMELNQQSEWVTADQLRGLRNLVAEYDLFNCRAWGYEDMVILDNFYTADPGDPLATYFYSRSKETWFYDTLDCTLDDVFWPSLVARP